MAHFAEVDENGVVVQVLVIPDEQEHRGQEYLADDLGLGGTWVQTSYNGTIRGNFAGLGMTYHADVDLFMPPKPSGDAVLGTETATWVWTPEAPVGEQVAGDLIVDILTEGQAP